MTCQIEYTLSGQHVYTTVEAPSNIDALLRVLETLPETNGVRALVKVLRLGEVVQ